MRKALVASAKTDRVTGEPGALGRAIKLALKHGRSCSAFAPAALYLLSTPIYGQTASPPEDTSASLPEVVVSAQRRTQSLQDVPYNISAMNGASLEQDGITSLNSLSQMVAGLNNVDLGPADRGGNSNLTLRGLRTEPPGGGPNGAFVQSLTVSSVSTYFGETPVFFQMPLDDIERVEVLRGPQGTLYGSGAQAGTIRFIPKRPDFDNWSGDIAVDGSWSDNAPKANGSAHAVLNVPLAENLALRVVAGEDHLAGFIDGVDRVQVGPSGTPIPSVPGDLTSGFTLGPVKRGVNSSDQAFARAALRWQPHSAVDIQLDYLHEHTSMQDSQLTSGWGGGPFDPSFGVWPNAVVDTRSGCRFCSTGWAGEPFEDTIDLASLVGTIDFGFGTMTVATSYYDDQAFTAMDQTELYYSIPNGSPYIPYYPYNNYPRLIAAYTQPSANRTFIEEVRFVSKQGHWVDYVAGAYYERQTESSDIAQNEYGITAYNAFIGTPNPTLRGDNNFIDTRDTKFFDRAVFGELTFHVTDKWQVTGGARFFNQGFTSNVGIELPLCGAICSETGTNPLGTETSYNYLDVSRHVWKVNTSYDITPDLKIYATYSEGFRRGGVTGLPLYGPFASPANLQTFAPDLAHNYELGMKGTAFDRRLRYFGDIYLINLQDFQFNGTSLSGIPAAYNGKNARSQGAEFEVQAAATSQLDFSLGYAFTRAYVSQSFDIQDYVPYALVPSLGGTGQTASLFGAPIAAGTPLPGVPRHSLTLGADYDVPSLLFQSWDWRFHVDASYRSSEEASIQTQSVYAYTIPASTVVNARVTASPDNHWSYQAYINNVFNNEEISGTVGPQTYSTPYQLRDIGRPRTIGAQLKYRF